MARVEIEYNDLPRNPGDETYVRAQLREWMKRHSGAKSSARVEFFRGPFENRVGCYLEVLQDGSVLRNFEYGKGVPYTFHRCLKHLAENSLIEHNNEERSAS